MVRANQPFYLDFLSPIAYTATKPATAQNITIPIIDKVLGLFEWITPNGGTLSNYTPGGVIWVQVHTLTNLDAFL